MVKIVITFSISRKFFKGPAWLSGNPGVLDSNHMGSSGFAVGVSLGKTLQNPSLVLVKPRKDKNNVSCGHDMTERLLKVALKMTI